MQRGAAEHVLATLGQGRTPPPDAVQAVLADAMQAQGVAWHPTGFVVARLCERGAETLRLHVWPAEERVYGEPLWPFHDHVFSLWSLVLAGTIGSVHMHVVAAEHGAHRRYAVEYGAEGASRLVAQGTAVESHAGATTQAAAGRVYAIAAGEYHASFAPQGRLAATLVATRATDRRRPFVLGPASGPQAVAVQRVEVSRTRWRALLDQVRDEATGDGPASSIK